MKKSVLLALWAGAFVLCAGLGFLSNPAEGLRTFCTAMSLLFFVPPFRLLWQARQGKDLPTILFIRNLSALSLLLSMVLLIGNFLSVAGSKPLGDILYYVLVIVSSPMICSGYWALSLFLWACLLMTAQKFRKEL